MMIATSLPIKAQSPFFRTIDGGSATASLLPIPTAAFGSMDLLPGQRLAVSLGSLSNGDIGAKQFSASYAINSLFQVGVGLSKDADIEDKGRAPAWSVSALMPFVSIIPIRQGDTYPVTVFATGNLMLTSMENVAPGNKLSGYGYGVGVSHGIQFTSSVRITSQAHISMAAYTQDIPEATVFVLGPCPSGEDLCFPPPDPVEEIVPGYSNEGNQWHYALSVFATVTVRPGAVVFAGPTINVFSESNVHSSETGFRLGIATGSK